MVQVGSYENGSEHTQWTASISLVVEGPLAFLVSTFLLLCGCNTRCLTLRERSSMMCENRVVRKILGLTREE